MENSLGCGIYGYSGSHWAVVDTGNGAVIWLWYIRVIRVVN